MERKKILILVGAFFATLPISYTINAYILLGGVLIVPVFILLRALSVEVYWVTGASIAYISSTILTSLFFTLIAWLLIKSIKDQRKLIPIVVFFATLPVSLIITLFNPLARLLFDILRTRMGTGLVPSILVLSFTIVSSLLLAFLTWFLIKSKKNSKVQTEG